MSAFTPVDIDVDWLQKLTYINEIILAFSERRLALGPTTDNFIGNPEASLVSPFVAGADAQDYWYVWRMQEWLERNCVSYLKHTQPISGSFTPPMWNWSNLCAALPGGGWRRATAWVPDPDTPDWTVDPTWLTPGKAQAGDIIGPWIFDDLQKVMSLLRWTKTDGSPGGPVIDGQRKTPALPHGDSDCSVAYGNESTDWAGASWQDYNSTIYEAYASGGYIGTPSPYLFESRRCKGKPYCNNICATIPAECEIYLLPQAFFVGQVFKDVDGLGFVADQLKLIETIASQAAATRTGTMFGNISTSPLANTSLACPISTAWSEGVWITAVWFVMKWNFTNQT